MSSPTTRTSLQSTMTSSDTKKHSNFHYRRNISSSLRVKGRAQRPSIGDLFESRWSLYSVNSVCTDEFNWSLQPSYLKMMNDTNLMDSCRAAKEEIESVQVHPRSSRQLQFLNTNKSKARRSTVDPEQMLQWIVYMEKYLKTFSPDWREVNKMDEQQLNVSFVEQCELRQYIASYNPIFIQMIREEDSPRTRDVQDKFHILLLNAIEKQCLLESGPTVESNSVDRPDLNLDVYKLCSVDIDPHYYSDCHDYTLTRSTETLSSDADTIITSDDGVNFPTHPTTSKSSIFSEDHCSPFSSNRDFQHDGQNASLENILKEFDDIIGLDSSQLEAPTSNNELQTKHRNASSSSISACTLKLIENVDLMLPKAATPNLDEYLNANNKVDDWLLHHPNETSTATKPKIGYKIGLSSSSGSDLGSTLSIQWDNFQDIYTLTAPIHEEVNNDFLYFGDDYDDALKGKRIGSMSSISDIMMRKSSVASVPTTPSRSEKSWPKCQENKHETVGSSNEMKIVSRKRKRVSRKLNPKNDSMIQQTSPGDSSKMAKDILLIAEELRNNYKNLKPQDFDGILSICKENLGCLIVVLDKDHHHCRLNESMDSVGDDRIYIQENCRCGVIGQFVAQLVLFLYDCSRSVRRSPIYRFLMKFLKNLYSMVKFLSHKVRVYRSLYGKY